jgi:hypothetical protein
MVNTITTKTNQKETTMARYIDYTVKHGIVRVTETQLEYVESIVPANMRYNTADADAGACIIDLGDSCFNSCLESGEKLPDWLNAVIDEAVSDSMHFLHFVAD